MNAIFKKMLDVSRKLGIDRFVMEDEYIIGGYDLVENMDYDKWATLCNEINLIFSEDIDKSEYYKTTNDDNPPFSFCIKSNGENYYFEDATLSFLPKRTLKDVKKMLDLLDIPYISNKDCIRIDKKILNGHSNELIIEILSDGDCDGLDAFQYIVYDEAGVSYVAVDFYHLLEEFSQYLNCDYINKNNKFLYYNKKDGCLTRRKSSELLKSVLKVNDINFSQIDSNNFMIELNNSKSIKVFVNETNNYVVNWDSNIKTFEHEACLIDFIKNKVIK